MFEEASDNAVDADVFADIGHAGPQAADTAHDQVDFDAGLRSPVEGFDDCWIHQAVHLGDNGSGSAGASLFTFAFDAVEHAPHQAGGRDQQLLEVGFAIMRGEQVEDFGDFGGDCGFGGDQPEVGVKAGGGVVVVAGAQVCVTAQAVLVTADQHRELAVDLEAHDAVDHVDAALFHALGPFDIGGLVAAGLQLDEHGNFFAAFGRVD